MTSRTEYCTQTPNKPSLFDVQYLRKHRTLDIGVLGYIGIVWPKEHSPEVRSFPPGTLCIHTHTHTYISDIVQTVYELPLLPNNTAVKQIGKNRSDAKCWLDIYLGAPVWWWLGEYVTLDRTFHSLLLKQKVLAALLLSHFVTYRVPRRDLY